MKTDPTVELWKWVDKLTKPQTRRLNRGPDLPSPEEDEQPADQPVDVENARDAELARAREAAREAARVRRLVKHHLSTVQIPSLWVLLLEAEGSSSTDTGRASGGSFGSKPPADLAIADFITEVRAVVWDAMVQRNLTPLPRADDSLRRRVVELLVNATDEQIQQCIVLTHVVQPRPAGSCPAGHRCHERPLWPFGPTHRGVALRVHWSQPVNRTVWPGVFRAHPPRGPPRCLVVVLPP